MPAGGRHARGLRPLLIAIACGVLATYTFAWACALWSPLTTRTPPTILEQRSGLGHDSAHASGFSARVARNARGFSESGRWYFKEWAGRGDAEFRAGWPAPALVSHVRSYRATPSGSAAQGLDLPIGVILTRGIPTSRLPAALRAQPDRRLPILPLWPGFVINVAFFALLSAAAASVLRHAREHHRVTRGRCVRCGYCRTGILRAVCPECGAQATNQRISSPAST